MEELKQMIALYEKRLVNPKQSAESRVREIRLVAFLKDYARLKEKEIPLPFTDEGLCAACPGCDYRIAWSFAQAYDRCPHCGQVFDKE